jgi:hypothetical protein
VHPWETLTMRIRILCVSFPTSYDAMPPDERQRDTQLRIADFKLQGVPLKFSRPIFTSGLVTERWHFIPFLLRSSRNPSLIVSNCQILNEPRSI